MVAFIMQGRGRWQAVAKNREPSMLAAFGGRVLARAGTYPPLLNFTVFEFHGFELSILALRKGSRVVELKEFPFSMVFQRKTERTWAV